MSIYFTKAIQFKTITTHVILTFNWGISFVVLFNIFSWKELDNYFIICNNIADLCGYGQGLLTVLAFLRIIYIPYDM